jgi:hypothetical protein
MSVAELISREGFDPQSAFGRFFADWERLLPAYFAEQTSNEAFRAIVDRAWHYYQRMATNDWTP